MRKLILTAVALTGLAGAIAPVASAAPGRHVAELGRDRGVVTQVDYNWHHHRWHHRQWDHGHWRYYN